MTTTTDNIIISLNSKYGTKQNGSYLSSILFDFKGILTDDKQILKKYITLINAQIPVSFYIINEHNNKLVMIAESTAYSILLDYGNYTATSLISELLNKIPASGIPRTCTIGLNKISGKLSFIFNGTVQFKFSLSTISSVLGFDADIFGTTINMTYPIDLLGTRNIYIKSQNLNIVSFDSYSNQKNNIIGSVSVDEAFYNMVSYSSSNNIQHELKLKTLDIIDIQLTDENNNLINFNNINWTITLCLTIERVNAVILSDNLQQTISQTQIKTFEDALIEDDQIQPEKQLTEIKLDHRIDQPTTLSGTLKTYSEALIKGSNNYTSNIIEIIKSNGDNLITKMTLKRTPVREMTVKALNTASFGNFQKQNPYDKLFHLAVVLTLDNGRSYTLEKNATISLAEPIDKPNTEYQEVNYPTENLVSLNSLLEKTRQRMGKKYFTYSSKSNNCQDFLLNVFDANDIGGQVEREFIKQDTRKIFNSNPDYLKTMANLVTGTGARLDNTKSMLTDLYKHKTDLNFLLK